MIKPNYEGNRLAATAVGRLPLVSVPAVTVGLYDKFAEWANDAWSVVFDFVA